MATGTFFVMTNLSGIVGSLIVITLLHYAVNFNVVIWIMFILSAVASLMLSFAEHRCEYDDEDDNVATDDEVKLMPDGKTICAFLSNRVTWLLAPYMLCQGFNISFTFANLPTFANYATRYADAASTGHQLNMNVAYLFLVYGVGCLIGSFTWGAVYDRFNTHLWPLLCANFCIMLTANALLVASVLSPTSVAFYTHTLPVAMLFGLNDFLTNCIINNSNAKFYGESGTQLAHSFAWYRFWFSIGYVVASLTSAMVPRVDSQEPGTAWLGINATNLAITCLSISCAALIRSSPAHLQASHL